MRCRETNTVCCTVCRAQCVSELKGTVPLPAGYSTEAANFKRGMMLAVNARDGTAFDMIRWATGQRGSEIHFYSPQDIVPGTLPNPNLALIGRKKVAQHPSSRSRHFSFVTCLPDAYLVAIRGHFFFHFTNVNVEPGGDTRVTLL